MSSIDQGNDFVTRKSMAVTEGQVRDCSLTVMEFAHGFTDAFMLVDMLDLRHPENLAQPIVLTKRGGGWNE